MPDDAREHALRALGRRDVSVRELERRLEERGFPADERTETVELLLRTGLLDDSRFAEERALSLARRGAGDALIRHELLRAGIDAELVGTALSAVEPERERARRIVARRGSGSATARHLARKGFAEDVVTSVAGGVEEELG